MSRFKLVVFVTILPLVGILLGQNRQLLGLKFFCPDAVGQDCFYRTPDFPLAAWMAVFFVAGIVSSVAWQLLNQLASDKSNRPKQNNSSKTKAKASTRQSRFQKQPVEQPSSNVPLSDWEEEANRDWEPTDNRKNSSSREVIKDNIPKKSPAHSSQVPTDSTYSYNFSEPANSKKPQPNNPKSNRDNTKDDVYDATYRTVKAPNNSPDASSDNNDNEEQWI